MMEKNTRVSLWNHNAQEINTGGFTESLLAFLDDVCATLPIDMLNSINKRGGNAQLKICYGLGHNAWDVAYDGDELTEWLLSHRKK